MTDTHYHFLSTVRQGLAAFIASVPEGKRPEIGLQLHAARRVLSTGAWDDTVAPIDRTVQTYGPGDIASFDERIIVRREPRPGSGNFEPNYFPAVEFADPDYPWRFSPEPAAAGGSSAPNDVVALTPWIALVVLVAEDRGENTRREFEDLPRQSTQRPAVRVLSQQNLPNLTHAWRWAHVQATTGGESLIADRLAAMPPDERDALSDDDLRVVLGEEVAALYAARPELVVSRLICPRRLSPRTLYRAFIVPTYRHGWAAAMDTPEAYAAVEGASAIALAWDHTSGDPIDLPCLHPWEFRTSERGDFEYLVRLLEPRELEGLGLRTMDCESPGFGLTVERSGVDVKQPHHLDLEGALQSLETVYTRWGKDGDGAEIDEFRQRLADEVLNQAVVSPRVSLGSGFGAGIVDDFTVAVMGDGRSVRFAWRTSGPSTGLLDYGAEDEAGGYSYADVAASDTLGTLHSVTVPLVPETTYHFRLRVQTDTEAATADAEIKVPLPAVVPPIYGRWHAARQTVSAADSAEEWLDVLNLDPRHRAAAGLGAEVVRKQQEALMASAWDQIGAIEAANDLLRRAQLGREGSIFLHNRLLDSALEDFLRLTGPVQRRVTRSDGDGGKQTVRTELAQEHPSLTAALSPALRRIARPRGPIRRIQGVRRTDMLRRLLTGRNAAGKSEPLRPAGPHLAPEGTPRPCSITTRMYQDAVAEAWGESGSEGVTTVGTGVGIPGGADGVAPSSGVAVTGMAGTIAAGSLAGVPSNVAATVTGPTGGVGMPASGIVPSPLAIPVPESAKRFCDDRIGCELLKRVTGSGPVLGPMTAPSSAARPPGTLADALSRVMTVSGAERAITPGVAGAMSRVKMVGTTDPLVAAGCQALRGVLRTAITDAAASKRDIEYVRALRADIAAAIDPRATIPARMKLRLRLRGPLARRFDDGERGDPLDEIMAYPEFPQPMYEPLRGLSQSHILPGVEKIPPNTVGVLETNGRFVESYMVGLNHEFAGELLWRRYPTDQRGSYFRQFWDVDEYVPDSADEVGADGKLTEGAKEKLKDILELHKWGETPLGDNDNRKTRGKGEALVLVVRGDLLQRYPDALVYAINARAVPVGEGQSEKLMPRLAEFGDGTANPVFPLFRGSLGADLVFLGFPFDEASARSERASDGTIVKAGMFFVLEERASEPRFGLDVETEHPVDLVQWADLEWGHFGLSPGQYLDASSIVFNVDDEEWNAHTDAALRARITLQKPARLVVHADQMLPS